MGQLRIGAATGRKKAGLYGEEATERIKDAGTYATNRASEEAKKAKNRVQEEL